MEARTDEERHDREEQAGERPALRVVVRVMSRRMVILDGGGGEDGKRGDVPIQREEGSYGGGRERWRGESKGTKDVLPCYVTIGVTVTLDDLLLFLSEKQENPIAKARGRICLYIKTAPLHPPSIGTSPGLRVRRTTIPMPMRTPSSVSGNLPLRVECGVTLPGLRRPLSGQSYPAGALIRPYRSLSPAHAAPTLSFELPLRR